MLIDVYTFLMVVLIVLHVSVTYSSTDFTFELNMRIFGCNVEFYIFLSYTNAPLALPVIAQTSASMPLCSSMTVSSVIGSVLAILTDLFLSFVYVEAHL